MNSDQPEGTRKVLRRNHTADRTPSLGRLALTAWLAGPPELGNDPEFAMALITDLLLFLRGGEQRFRVDSVLTDEPRIYPTDSQGLADLARRIRAKSARELDFAGESRDRAVGDVTAHITLGRSLSFRSPLATAVGVALRPADGHRLADTTERVVGFVKRWFVAMSAVSAFVSNYGALAGRSFGDHSTATEHEHGAERTVLLEWEDLRRFARGAFWGTGLGPDLCARLGGRERVLSEAPAARKEPLGEGVWLQLSAAPPTDQSSLETLRVYLQPLLEWTRVDLATQFPNGPRERSGGGHGRLASRDSASSPRVSVQVLPRFHEDHSGGLNIYLGAPPTSEEQEVIERTVRSWYDSSFQASSSGAQQAGFHDIRGPTVEAQVMRWFIDLGMANAPVALDALAAELGRLGGVKVDRLVVGTEET
jgi:hypothetical protein